MEKSLSNMSDKREPAYPLPGKKICWWGKKGMCWGEIARRGELAQKCVHSLAHLLILLLNASGPFSYNKV